MGVEPAETDQYVSLADQAYQRIQDMIVAQALPPGSMVSENSLRDELGFGRTPIREALQRLRLEGFIDIHPRRGALVTSVDVTKQFELLELRRPLELLLNELAAERASSQERIAMREIGDDLVAAAVANDRVRYLAANKAVHAIRIAAAHNDTMGRTMHVVFGLSRRFWFHYIEDSGAFIRAATLHRDTLSCIAAGSVDEAQAATRAFLDFLTGLTEAIIARTRR